MQFKNILPLFKIIIIYLEYLDFNQANYNKMFSDEKYDLYKKYLDKINI